MEDKLEYDKAFFENLMYGGTNVLSNRAMHDTHPLHKEKVVSDRQTLIFCFIQRNPGSSAVSISKETGIPLRTVQREIASMSGKIIHKGSSKTGGYYIADKY